MSTLTYSQSNYAPVAGDERAHPRPHTSIWRRFFDSIIAARQRRADREIAAYIASRGGYLTDEVERDLMRRLGNGNRMTRA